MENNFTVDYFIEKFEKIPEEKWIIERLTVGDKHCAFGHCDSEYGAKSEEGKSLAILKSEIAYINDGKDMRYQQATPKQRVLAALRDIKKKEDGQATSPEEKPKPEPKPQPEKIRYVSVLVDKPIVEQAKELIEN